MCGGLFVRAPDESVGNDPLRKDALTMSPGRIRLFESSAHRVGNATLLARADVIYVKSGLVFDSSQGDSGFLSNCRTIGAVGGVLPANGSECGRLIRQPRRGDGI
jgi:hypothetical protein